MFSKTLLRGFLSHVHLLLLSYITLGDIDGSVKPFSQIYMEFAALIFESE